METVRDQDLVKGKIYRAILDDCCIQGEFTSRLTGIRRDQDDDRLWFENGVTLTCFYQVSWELVDE